jgi:predicted metal-dependent enzyme (double-stranded beta helix superfamily)
MQVKYPPDDAPALRRFVSAVRDLTSGRFEESIVVNGVRDAMRILVGQDDWLDEARAKHDATFYRQYLLHADPAGRFSVVSFVWGPGQRTPIHDHGTWGVIGMLRGAEIEQRYCRDGAGRLLPDFGEERLEPGDVAVLRPSEGDIHVVRNAFEDRTSISIHAYGVDIGRQERHVYDPFTGAPKKFVSGYSIPDADT